MSLESKLLNWCGHTQAALKRRAMAAQGKHGPQHFHRGRQDLEDSGLNFFRRKRRQRRSVKCWWRGSQEPCPGGDDFRLKLGGCKPTNSSGWRKYDQLWLFCAIISQGGEGSGWSPPGKRAHYLCLQAQGRASHLAGWSLGVKFCPGIRLLNTRCSWCSAFGTATQSQSTGLPRVVKITHAQIHQGETKEKAGFGRRSCLSCFCQEALWQPLQSCWGVREIKIRP